MSVDRPQEQPSEPEAPERVEDETDGAPAREAERLQVQHEEPDLAERVEDETDGAAAREAERLHVQHEEPDLPERVGDETDGAAAREVERLHVEHEEPDLPERVGDETDGAAAREAERPATAYAALPEGDDAGPESTAGEQMAVPPDREAEAGPTLPAGPSPALSDFQVFGPGELQTYRSLWESIQLGFLDDPKGAAEQADEVVSELLGRLAERREALREELNRRSNRAVDTESMRLAVRNYRLLFHSLVGG